MAAAHSAAAAACSCAAFRETAVHGGDFGVMKTCLSGLGLPAEGPHLPARSEGLVKRGQDHRPGVARMLNMVVRGQPA